MVLTQKFKSYVSEFTIRLGPIQTTGSLIGVREPQSKPKGTKIVSCTPEGEPVKQVYVPASNPSGTQYTMGQLGRATLNEDGSLTVIPKGALDQAKEPEVPKDTMAVTVHPQSEVDDSLFPSDNNAYVFQPNDADPVNLQWYSLLHASIKVHPERAFIGSANVRNSEGLYRLTLWRDRLVLQRMLYPEDLNDHEPLDIEPIDDTIVAKFSKQLDKLTKEFDPTVYRDTTKDRIAAVQAAYASGEATNVITVAPKSKVTFDIMDALEAFDVD